MLNLSLVPTEAPPPRRDAVCALVDYYEDDDEADYDDGEDEDLPASMDWAAEW